MRTILIIILIILLLGALPTWPYSSGWGYYPSGGLGLVLLIVLILWLMGRIWPVLELSTVRWDLALSALFGSILCVGHTL